MREKQTKSAKGEPDGSSAWESHPLLHENFDRLEVGRAEMAVHAW